MLSKFVIAYIDDILSCSPDLDSHKVHVKLFLAKLLNNHLFIKAEKCEFHVTLISFLEYLISAQGVRIDQDKVLALIK